MGLRSFHRRGRGGASGGRRIHPAPRLSRLRGGEHPYDCDGQHCVMFRGHPWPELSDQLGGPGAPCDQRSESVGNRRAVDGHGATSLFDSVGACVMTIRPASSVIRTRMPGGKETPQLAGIRRSPWWPRPSALPTVRVTSAIALTAWVKEKKTYYYMGCSNPKHAPDHFGHSQDSHLGWYDRIPSSNAMESV